MCPMTMHHLASYWRAHLHHLCHLGHLRTEQQLKLRHQQQSAVLVEEGPHPCKKVNNCIVRASKDEPFNLEASDAKFCADIPYQPIELNLFGWVLLHLLIIVLRILIIANAHELLVFIGSRKNESRNTKGIFWWYFGWIWRCAFEFEGVDANRDRSNETVVKFLVEFFVSG